MDPWLRAATEAAHELAVTALGCELAVEAKVECGPLQNATGCFVALAGQDASVQIGVASDVGGCHALAQALLGEAIDLPIADVNDALGEMTNIVAGGVKKRMAEAFPFIHLGLPLVVQGCLQPAGHQKMTYIPVRFGEILAKLIVIYDSE